MSLSILCFGDSLTAGYTKFGTEYKPYSEKLRKVLQAAFPNVKFDIEIDGLPGALVRDDFDARIKSHFKKGVKTFDWTIVLGGTNDLGTIDASITPESIFADLQSIWGIALSHGSRVFAMTVPEANAKLTLPGKTESIIVERDRLNAMIKGYQRDGFHFFDLNKALPYFALQGVDKKKYWDDGLHLTEDGYDRVGQLIGEAMVRALSR